MHGKFPIAIHIMTLLCYAEEQLSSECIAGSLNVSPVLVRKALHDLMANGLVLSRRGKRRLSTQPKCGKDIPVRNIHCRKTGTPVGHEQEYTKFVLSGWTSNQLPERYFISGS